MKVADDFRRAERRIMILGQQNTCQRLASFILDLLCLPEFSIKTIAPENTREPLRSRGLSWNGNEVL